PIPVLGLRRIERGERRVDLDELVALAKALGVPPLWLVLPVGVVERTEILPGVVRDTWEAAQWFTGEAPLTTEPIFGADGKTVGYTQSSADFNEWHAGARPLELAREHERRLTAFRLAVMAATADLASAREATGEQREHLDRIADESVRELRQCE